VAEEKGADEIRDRNRRIREEAAAKRRSKREAETKAARRPTLGQLEASEIMDDAFARTTHAVTGWVRRHFTFVQWALVAAIVLGMGYQVYSSHRSKVEGKTTEALAAALSEEMARVSDTPAEDDPQLGLADTRPQRKTHEERLKAAEAAYRKATEGKFTSLLGRLGLAGVLYDEGKYKEALAEYRAVRESPLASEDSDVRTRTIEGIGLSQEAAGDLDAAKKTFHELENQDSAPASALGLYHQARIEKKQGETEKAKTHLIASIKKITDNKIKQAYVEGAARELLGMIDPSALPPVSPDSLSKEQLEALEKRANQAKTDVSPDKLKELLEKIKKEANVNGQKPPAPASAPSPAPAPSPSGGAP
jgi:hypothetical protein